MDNGMVRTMLCELCGWKEIKFGWRWRRMKNHGTLRRQQKGMDCIVVGEQKARVGMCCIRLMSSV